MCVRTRQFAKKESLYFVCLLGDLQSTSFAFGDDDHVLRRGWERLSVLVSIRWNSVFQWPA